MVGFVENSHHITLLFDIDDVIEQVSEEDKFILKKTDWVKRKKNEEWNQINPRKEDIQEMYELFLSVWESCMERCVPKKKNTFNKDDDTHFG